MALQFRRGLTADLPDPSDAAIGEPLFTTDEGKLRIKKADGSFAVIGGDASSSIDLSGIDADSLVKVNADQDGFVAAAGGDLPSHTHPPSEIEQASATNGQVLAWNGSAWSPTTVSEDAGAAWGQITGTLSAQTDLNSALAAKVNESDLPQDGSGNLDIAQESTLQAFSTQVSSLQSSVNALGYLSTYFTDAALPATPGATGGYLKWDPASGGSWAIDANQITAPSVINGGNATSFGS